MPPTLVVNTPSFYIFNKRMADMFHLTLSHLEKKAQSQCQNVKCLCETAIITCISHYILIKIPFLQLLKIVFIVLNLNLFIIVNIQIYLLLSCVK